MKLPRLDERNSGDRIISGEPEKKSKIRPDAESDAIRISPFREGGRGSVRIQRGPA